MVVQFLTGVIVGVLIGLAISPLLREWVLWQRAERWRDPTLPDRASETTHQPDPR